jgi:hypothetical protein
MFDSIVIDAPPAPDTDVKQRERAANEKAALRASTSKFPEQVRALVDLVGAPLTAYLGNVDETRAVREWIAGRRVPHPATQAKLQLALQIAAFLYKEEGTNASIAAWFQGMNPALEDAAPATLIRDAAGGTALLQTSRRILAAAREFVDI